jgi:hypothetical protein
MANSGINHVVTSVPVPRSQYESEEHHALVSGTSFPASPVEKQLFYRTDLHQLYIYNGTSWVDCTSQGVTVHNNLTNRDAADCHPLASITDLVDHSARHELAGADVISLAGLSGEPAELTTHKGLTTGVHSFNKTCRLWNNAAQSISNAAWNIITFNTEKWDTDGMHSTVSNTDRITCVTAGVYLAIAVIYFDISSVGNRQLIISRGGVVSEINTYEGNPPADGGCLCFGFCLISFAAGEWLRLYAYQNSGGALNSLSTDPVYPQFGATRIA